MRNRNNTRCFAEVRIGCSIGRLIKTDRREVFSRDLYTNFVRLVCQLHPRERKRERERERQRCRPPLSPPTSSFLFFAARQWNSVSFPPLRRYTSLIEHSVTLLLVLLDVRTHTQMLNELCNTLFTVIHLFERA